MNLNIKENIKNFLDDNYKKIVFILIFISFYTLYNINNQTLNYFLKRGTVLEYSLSQNENINENNIEKFLIHKNIKYSYVNSGNIEKYTQYDKDNNKIQKILYVGLPIILNENNKDFFNDISKYIYNNHTTAKLLNVKPLNDNYHKPFNTGTKIIHILVLSLFLWFLIFNVIIGKKEKKEEKITTKKNIKLYLKNLKNTICNPKQLIKECKIKVNAQISTKKQITKQEVTKKFLSELWELIYTIIFVIICVILIRYFLGELRWIPSGSMRPTILEKDRVFVEKLEYPTKEINRGDILVFYPPEVKLKNNPLAILSRLSGIFCKDIAFIKRVVGMPNDKFEIKLDNNSQEYRVFINDKALNEPYIITKTQWTPCTNKMYCGPFKIPENHYFMMGDNRGNSQDSRFWGFLDKNRVIGRANFMFWPIHRINPLIDKYIILYSQKKNNKLIEQKYIINRYEFLYNI